MPGANTDSEPLDFPDALLITHDASLTPTHLWSLRETWALGSFRTRFPNALLPGSVALGSFASLSQLCIWQAGKELSGLREVKGRCAVGKDPSLSASCCLC